MPNNQWKVKQHVLNYNEINIIIYIFNFYNVVNIIKIEINRLY
jgi:hypothetical protein